MLSAGSPMRREHGFTLLEIIVAMTVMGVLVMAIGTVYPATAFVARSSRHVTYATRLAEERLEEIGAMGFAYVTPSAFPGVQTFTQAGMTFTRSVTVTPCATDPNPPCSGNSNLTMVSVRVDWTERSGNKNATITTLFHRYFYRFAF